MEYILHLSPIFSNTDRCTKTETGNLVTCICKLVTSLVAFENYFYPLRNEFQLLITYMSSGYFSDF